MVVEYTWTNVSCVYLLDNGMTIGDRSRLSTMADLALPSTLGHSAATHIAAECVQVTYPSINTLRVTWRRVHQSGRVAFSTAVPFLSLNFDGAATNGYHRYLRLLYFGIVYRGKNVKVL